MHAKGHRIEANFTLYFTLFIVTFAKGSPLLRVVFSGDRKNRVILGVFTQYLSSTGERSDGQRVQILHRMGFLERGRLSLVYSRKKVNVVNHFYSAMGFTLLP